MQSPWDNLSVISWKLQELSSFSSIRMLVIDTDVTCTLNVLYILHFLQASLSVKLHNGALMPLIALGWVEAWVLP